MKTVESFKRWIVAAAAGLALPAIAATITNQSGTLDAGPILALPHLLDAPARWIPLKRYPQESLVIKLDVPSDPDTNNQCFVGISERPGTAEWTTNGIRISTFQANKILRMATNAVGSVQPGDTVLIVVNGAQSKVFAVRGIEFQPSYRGRAKRRTP